MECYGTFSEAIVKPRATRTVDSYHSSYLSESYTWNDVSQLCAAAHDQDTNWRWNARAVLVRMVVDGSSIAVCSIQSR